MGLELVDLSLVVNRSCPWLEWNLLDHVLRQRRRSTVPAAGFLTGNGTDPRLAVGTAWCRSGGHRRSAATTASAALSAALGSGAALALTLLRRLGVAGHRQ